MLGVVRENGPQECDLNWANRHQLEDEGPRVESSIIASAGNMYSCISPISMFCLESSSYSTFTYSEGK